MFETAFNNDYVNKDCLLEDKTGCKENGKENDKERRKLKCYAIFKDKSWPYSFSRIHTTLEDAKQEAERLCRKEHKVFFVLQIVGKVSPIESPVKWEE